jgi:hypothetical protein
MKSESKGYHRDNWLSMLGPFKDKRNPHLRKLYIDDCRKTYTHAFDSTTPKDSPFTHRPKCYMTIIYLPNNYHTGILIKIMLDSGSDVNFLNHETAQLILQANPHLELKPMVGNVLNSANMPVQLQGILTIPIKIIIGNDNEEMQLSFYVRTRDLGDKPLNILGLPFLQLAIEAINFKQHSLTLLHKRKIVTKQLDHILEMKYPYSTKIMPAYSIKHHTITQEKSVPVEIFPPKDTEALFPNVRFEPLEIGFRNLTFTQVINPDENNRRKHQTIVTNQRSQPYALKPQLLGYFVVPDDNTMYHVHDIHEIHTAIEELKPYNATVHRPNKPRDHINFDFLEEINYDKIHITPLEIQRFRTEIGKNVQIYTNDPSGGTRKINQAYPIKLKENAELTKKPPSKIPIHQRHQLQQLLIRLEKEKVISQAKITDEHFMGQEFENWILAVIRNGKLEIAVDARRLNSQTDTDYRQWPLPPLEDLLLMIKGKYFCTIKIKDCHSQIPLTKESEKFASFSLGDQQWNYITAFPGLRGVTKFLTEFLANTFKDLVRDGKAVTYTDTVLLQSNSIEEMFKTLQTFHTYARRANIQFDLKKSQFFQKSVTFAAHTVTAKTVLPILDRVIHFSEIQSPNNRKELGNILSTWKMFEKNFFQIGIDFKEIKQHYKNEYIPYNWTPPFEKIFKSIQTKLTSNVYSNIPISTLPYQLHADASLTAAGCMLTQQLPNGDIRVVAFYKQMFTPAERRESTASREINAIVIGLEKFKHFLLGSPFPIILATDHRSVLYLFSKKDINQVQLEYQHKFAEFENLYILWKPGETLAIPDLLSRTTSDRIKSDEVERQTFLPDNLKFFDASGTEINYEILHDTYSREELFDSYPIRYSTNNSQPMIMRLRNKGHTTELCRESELKSYTKEKNTPQRNTPLSAESKSLLSNTSPTKPVYEANHPTDHVAISRTSVLSAHSKKPTLKKKLVKKTNSSPQTLHITDNNDLTSCLNIRLPSPENLIHHVSSNPVRNQGFNPAVNVNHPSVFTSNHPESMISHDVIHENRFIPATNIQTAMKDKRKAQTVYLPALKEVNTQFFKDIPLTPNNFSDEQNNDEILSIVTKWVKDGQKPELSTADIRGHTQLGAYYLQYENLYLVNSPKPLLLINDPSQQFQQDRICIPTTMLKNAFNSCHIQPNGKHLSRNHTLEIWKLSHYHPLLSNIATTLFYDCKQCNRVTMNHPGNALAEKTDTKTKLEELFFTIRGPYQTSSTGVQNLLILIDRTSLFITLITFGAKNAENISKAIETYWSNHYGRPKRVWTNSHEDHMTNKLRYILNMKHIETKIIEDTQFSNLRTRIGIIDQYLNHFTGTKDNTFQQIATKISLAINTQFKTSTGQTSFQLMYGTSPRFSLTQRLGFQIDERGICQPSFQDFCYGLHPHRHDDKRGIPKDFRHLTKKKMDPHTAQDINIQNQIFKFHQRTQHGTIHEQIHNIRQFREEHPLYLDDKTLILKLKSSDDDIHLRNRRLGPLVITRTFGNGYYQCEDPITREKETYHRDQMIYYKDPQDDLTQEQKDRILHKQGIIKKKKPGDDTLGTTSKLLTMPIRERFIPAEFRNQPQVQLQRLGQQLPREFRNQPHVQVERIQLPPQAMNNNNDIVPEENLIDSSDSSDMHSIPDEDILGNANFNPIRFNDEDREHQEDLLRNEENVLDNNNSFPNRQPILDENSQEINQPNSPDVNPILPVNNPVTPANIRNQPTCSGTSNSAGSSGIGTSVKTRSSSKQTMSSKSVISDTDMTLTPSNTTNYRPTPIKPADPLQGTKRKKKEPFPQRLAQIVESDDNSDNDDDHPAPAQDRVKTRSCTNPIKRVSYAPQKRNNSKRPKQRKMSSNSEEDITSPQPDQLSPDSTVDNQSQQGTSTPPRIMRTHSQIGLQNERFHAFVTKFRNENGRNPPVKAMEEFIEYDKSLPASPTSNILPALKAPGTTLAEMNIDTDLPALTVKNPEGDNTVLMTLRKLNPDNLEEETWINNQNFLQRQLKEYRQQAQVKAQHDNRIDQDLQHRSNRDTFTQSPFTSPISSAQPGQNDPTPIPQYSQSTQAYSTQDTQQNQQSQNSVPIHPNFTPRNLNEFMIRPEDTSHYPKGKTLSQFAARKSNKGEGDIVRKKPTKSFPDWYQQTKQTVKQSFPKVIKSKHAKHAKTVPIPISTPFSPTPNRRNVASTPLTPPRSIKLAKPNTPQQVLPKVVTPGTKVVTTTRTISNRHMKPKRLINTRKSERKHSSYYYPDGTVYSPMNNTQSDYHPSTSRLTTPPTVEQQATAPKLSDITTPRQSNIIAPNIPVVAQPPSQKVVPSVRPSVQQPVQQPVQHSIPAQLYFQQTTPTYIYPNLRGVTPDMFTREHLDSTLQEINPAGFYAAPSTPQAVNIPQTSVIPQPIIPQPIIQQSPPPTLAYPINPQPQIPSTSRQTRSVTRQQRQDTQKDPKEDADINEVTLDSSPLYATPIDESTPPMVFLSSDSESPPTEPIDIPNRMRSLSSNQNYTLRTPIPTDGDDDHDSSYETDSSKSYESSHSFNSSDLENMPELQARYNIYPQSPPRSEPSGYRRTQPPRINIETQTSMPSTSSTNYHTIRSDNRTHIPDTITNGIANTFDSISISPPQHTIGPYSYFPTQEIQSPGPMDPYHNIILCFSADSAMQRGEQHRIHRLNPTFRDTIHAAKARAGHFIPFYDHNNHRWIFSIISTTTFRDTIVREDIENAVRRMMQYAQTQNLRELHISRMALDQFDNWNWEEVKAILNRTFWFSGIHVIIHMQSHNPSDTMNSSL